MAVVEILDQQKFGAPTLALPRIGMLARPAIHSLLQLAHKTLKHRKFSSLSTYVT